MPTNIPRLARCLNPRSIAVIGGREAVQVVRQCRRLGFAGEIWAVNPKRAAAGESLEGLRCYADVQSLPAVPDCAFVAVPAAATVEAVAALAEVGGGGAVCYASGFSEVGAAGAELQRALIKAAAEMPVIGPNCYGFLNLTCGAAVWPDYHGASRLDEGATNGVAIFSQSGNVSLNLSMQRRALPLAWLVTLGNQAAVGVEDCIAAALADARIAAIGVHIEGLLDVPRFAALAARAREKRVPIIALKVGVSEAGARIVQSHTATLAGKDALYDALFARVGVGRVATPEEFVEALKLAAVAGVPDGNRIASMSCSGGEATLVADLAEGRALEFPALAETHRAAVQATLNEYVAVTNPLDYHTFIWGNRAAMTATFTAMMRGEYDLTLCVLDTPSDDAEATEVWMRAVYAFVDACAATGRRGAVVAILAENLPPEVARVLMAAGIAPLQGLAAAVAAVEAVCAVGVAWERAEAAPALCLARAAVTTAAVDEAEAKAMLAAVGVAVAKGEVVTSVSQAADAAARLGWPVVVKGLRAGLLHKSEAGAVAINLREAAEVRAAAGRMLDAGFARLLVEEMVEGAVAELVLGTAWDGQFGRYLLLGFGGVWAELAADRVVLLPPLDAAMVRAGLGRLRCAALLGGYRGRPAGDVEAVVEAVLRVVGMDVEVEVNPLVVLEEGAVAVDGVVGNP